MMMGFLTYDAHPFPLAFRSFFQRVFNTIFFMSVSPAPNCLKRIVSFSYEVSVANFMEEPVSSDLYHRLERVVYELEKAQ